MISSRYLLGFLFAIGGVSCGQEEPLQEVAEGARQASGELEETSAAGTESDPQILAARQALEVTVSEPGRGQKSETHAKSLEVELLNFDLLASEQLLVRARFLAPEEEAPARAAVLPPRTVLELSKSGDLNLPHRPIEALFDSRGVATLWDLPADWPIAIDVLRAGKVGLLQIHPQAGEHESAWRGNGGSRAGFLAVLPEQVQLAQNEERRLNFRLPEAADLHGRVVDEEGVGIAGLELWLGLPPADSIGFAMRACPRQMDRFAITYSIEDGSFEFREFPSGDWLVGIPLSVANARRAVRVFPLAVSIHAEPAAEVDLLLESATQGSISGRTLDERGEPLSGVLLSLRFDAIAGEIAATSDSDGTYEISPLPAGSFHLFASLGASTPPICEVGPLESRPGAAMLQDLRLQAGE